MAGKRERIIEVEQEILRSRNYQEPAEAGPSGSGGAGLLRGARGASVPIPMFEGGGGMKRARQQQQEHQAQAQDIEDQPEEQGDPLHGIDIVYCQVTDGTKTNIEAGHQLQAPREACAAMWLPATVAHVAEQELHLYEAVRKFAPLPYLVPGMSYSGNKINRVTLTVTEKGFGMLLIEREKAEVASVVGANVTYQNAISLMNYFKYRAAPHLKNILHRTTGDVQTLVCTDVYKKIFDVRALELIPK